MTQFITDPATVYGLLGYAIVMSIGAAALAYLWHIEKTAAEKAEKAAEHFDYKLNDLSVQLDVSKATNKILADTNAHLFDILSRAYVRNKYGIFQDYQDWAINGDRKPKPSTTSNQKRNG
jgi:hypothetical protein